MALDTKILNYLRPKAGVVGEPPGTGLTAGDAGLIAINFAGHTAAEKAADLAAIYSFDGSAWKHLNEATPVTTQTIDMTSGSAAAAHDIGAAYVAKGNPGLTGSVIVGTYGSPTAGAFLLTDKTNPGNQASWTPLGSATSIASGPDVTAGTDNTKMITSKLLHDELTRILAGIPLGGSAVSAPAQIGKPTGSGKILLLNAQGMVPAGALPFADLPAMKAGTAHDKIVAPKEFLAALAFMLKQSAANLKGGHVAEKVGGTSASTGKLVALNADGKIAASMLSLGGLHFIGSVDMSAAVPAAPAGGGFKNGDVYTHTKAGQTETTPPAPDATWHFDPDVHHVESGDMAIYDGTNWHHIATAADLTTAMLKTHSNLMSKDGKIIWGDSHAGAAPAAGTVIIDGGDVANAIAQNLTIKASIIECGTF